MKSHLSFKRVPLNFIASNENQSSKYVNGPDAKHEHYINAMHKLTRYVDKKKYLQ